MNKVVLLDHREELGRLQEIMDQYRGRPGGLIPVLQKAQDLFGYLPMEVQQLISEGLRVPLPEVYGVVTFYSQFTMVKKGKHQISVCLGTACYIRGAKDILAEIQKHLEIEVGQTSADGLFTIDATRCIGACGLAPVITIGKDVYGRLETRHVKGILDKYRHH
jgi:NADH:ubiquinone oxidoreductase subunit E